MKESMDNLRRLVIRVSRGSLSFSTLRDTQVVYEPYALKSGISVAANLREALRSVPLLNERFGRVLVLADSPVLMLPTTVYHEDEQEALYRYTFTPQEQQVVLSSVLPDLNTVALFAVAKDLRTVITDAYDHVRFAPVMSSVWRHLNERSYSGQRQKLYGYFHDRRLEVCCFAQNRFKFCNQFPVSNASDALFFLLSVWKQLSLKADADELHLAGDVKYRAELLEEAEKYVKRVYCINPSGEFNRAPVTQIAGIPYDLITLYMKSR